jgi:phage shock protein C
MKKLHRSKENKVVSGLIGGVGEYFEVDPVIIRLFWIVIVVLTGVVPGIIAYLLGIFVVPKAN